MVLHLIPILAVLAGVAVGGAFISRVVSPEIELHHKDVAAETKVKTDIGAAKVETIKEGFVETKTSPFGTEMFIGGGKQPEIGLESGLFGGSQTTGNAADTTKPSAQAAVPEKAGAFNFGSFINIGIILTIVVVMIIILKKI